MPTPDFPDWTQPVQVLDQSVDLAGGQVPVGNGVTRGPYDVSALNSVLLQVAPPATTVGNKFLMQAIWNEGGQLIGIDQFTTHDRISYSPGIGGYVWNLPCRGSTVKFQWSGDTVAQAQIRVIGSTRAIPAVRLQTFSVAQGLVQMTATVNVPAAGQLARIYIPPVSRAYSLRLSSSVTQMTYQLFGTEANEGGVMTARELAFITSVPPSNLVNNFVIPFTALEMVIANSDTAIHSASSFIWDVS